MTIRQGVVTVVLFVIGALLVLPTAARAQEITADEIVEKSNRVAYYQGRDGRANVEMTITDKAGATRNKAFIMLRRDDRNPDGPDDDTYCEDQKFYVYFTLPPDERGTVFMVWKHADIETDDDRWLYLPALDLVKRIASTQKRTSFVGSHFFYEDVSGRNIHADNHELIETTDTYYVLKSTPKDPDSVEFAWFKTYIHKDTFLPTTTEYYDDQDNKYREYRALKVEKIQGFQTVTQSEMSDNRIGGKTVIEYTNVKYNVDLPEDIFTERYLRTPPRKHLR